MSAALVELWPLAVGLLGLGLGLTLWWVFRRKARGAPRARLERAAERLLSDVLLPHAETGQIHVGYILLTRNAILVLDLREANGHVFGSEAMQEWTVLDRNRRFTFANPLPLLYDRIAAVKRIVPDLPVRGLVLFGAGSQFSKGFPPHVMRFDDLVRELEADRGVTAEGTSADALASAWTALEAASRGV